MSTVERAQVQAGRRNQRILIMLADEFRDARLRGGLSQQRVADAVGTSRARYGRIEAGKVGGLSIAQACRVAAALSLELSCRVYPSGDGLRDSAQVRKLDRLAAAVAAPLRWRIEVPLPPVPGRVEMRSWDATVALGEDRSTIEVEMRLRDAQAVARRVALKRRDDPSVGFLLVVADTDRNRRVLALHPDLFPDLPRVRPSRLFSCLSSGMLPPSGLVLL